MSTPNVTMPTRMYSSGVFIRSLLSLLEAFTALGEADEGQKCDNSYDNNKQIKHAVSLPCSSRLSRCVSVTLLFQQAAPLYVCVTSPMASSDPSLPVQTNPS